MPDWIGWIVLLQCYKPCERQYHLHPFATRPSLRLPTVAPLPPPCLFAPSCRVLLLRAAYETKQRGSSLHSARLHLIFAILSFMLPCFIHSRFLTRGCTLEVHKLEYWRYSSVSRHSQSNMFSAYLWDFVPASPCRWL